MTMHFLLRSMPVHSTAPGFRHTKMKQSTISEGCKEAMIKFYAAMPPMN